MFEWTSFAVMGQCHFNYGQFEQNLWLRNDRNRSVRGRTTNSNLLAKNKAMPES